MVGFVGSSAVAAGKSRTVRMCCEKPTGGRFTKLERLGVEATTLAIMMTPAVANADGLEEAFKTKPAALAHPTAMWLLFASSVLTFTLGFKVREIRSTDDIALKKELVAEKPGQRHFNLSSGILAATTFFTFEGMANTYTRAGKLFPGPHLYNGLGLVFTLSLMAAMVPPMQKNKGWAKNAHFGLAFVCLGLFGWQAWSGMKITFKVLGLDFPF